MATPNRPDDHVIVPPLDVKHVVRGQYEGYRTEPGVAADSYRWHLSGKDSRIAP
jgi:hypothetical protein